MSLKDRLNKSNLPKTSFSLKDVISDNDLGGTLSSEIQNLKEKLHSILIDKINSTPSWDKYSDEEQKQIIRHYIEKRLISEQKNIPLNKTEKEILIRGVLQEIKGYGPLDPLLADPGVSDILVNGPKHIYIEKDGKLYKTNVSFKDDDHLMNIIERMVSRVGRRIDEKSPMVDARLQDGSRINAIIPPLAIDGPSLSIRRFKNDAANLESLLKWGAMTTTMADTLKAAVKARLNIVISGGTGAGKTTLLNSLSSQIPNGERIITIEDSAELSLQQDHIVRLETRPPNIEGTGSVSTRDLVINALRMRPDRIIIGECRGAETLDMLQAMNTGHDGSLTTLHSNTPRDALNRLETLVLFSGVELPEKTIRSQISSAIQIIVQVSRLSDGSRRITHITEVLGMEGTTIITQDIFKWEQQGLDEKGKVIGCHVATGIRPKFVERCKAKGINLPYSLFDPTLPPVYLCQNPPNRRLMQGHKNKAPIDRSLIGDNKSKTSTNNTLINRLKK